tara:strand:+ start:12172 stop:13104 length:933 start_codon:yes stop_codon:yes gene_type:complete
MRLLKIGDKNPDVQKVQQKLGLTPDGHFGPLTEKHVIRFQLSNGLTADGIVGSETWSLMLSFGTRIMDAIDEDNDISSQYFKTNFDQTIHRYHLAKEQYVIHNKNTPADNKYIFLHHTAGNANPYRCIDHWGRDSRGRIATEFVLGGQNHRNNNDDYDGIMVQAFPEGNQGYHLGRTGSGKMNRKSVGIEICNMGYLDNDHKTYVGSKCHIDQVCELPTAFKGKLYWHNYTEKQIKETEKWIKWVGERDGVDVRIGLKQYIQKYGPTKGFEFQEDAFYGKVEGLLTHTNVRKGKMDCYPHPDLVDMIMSL